MISSIPFCTKDKHHLNLQSSFHDHRHSHYCFLYQEQVSYLQGERMLYFSSVDRSFSSISISCHFSFHSSFHFSFYFSFDQIPYKTTRALKTHRAKPELLILCYSHHKSRESSGLQVDFVLDAAIVSVCHYW